MTIRRGVSLYSFQQAQFFKGMMLDDQLSAVAAIPGASGIEIVDEMSLRYPDPGAAFVDRWHARLDALGLQPVAMDVGMDVLQFRDHVMTAEECAQRLRHDLQLAKRLGFSVVRVLSTTPLAVMLGALDLAETLDIRLGKEVHQPMALEGPQVTEILEVAAKTGTRHLGIVPDLGIYQFQPSEALLKAFLRKGARPEACAAATALSALVRQGGMGRALDVSLHTAGNIRSDFRRFLASGVAPAHCAQAFQTVRDFTRAHVPDPAEVDFIVVGEALTFSRTAPETLRQMARHVVNVHAKFYEMSGVPGRDGQWHDASIDYPAAIAALKAGGYDGFLMSEYEGQRYYQDRGRADLMNELDQVQKHQAMMAGLLAEG